ncbi:LysR family transcriptional regulator [Corallincola luteus]|uniref:LysR family transcriptional regulator n=1 Tax=Corallincola luteus TaxID=1775177 RepID=A0ABY2AM87_9GAMM|nr:LysR family transcriptional regulator [Corallincola luteus]TCI02426.1 LysR family transcriptional regulator [Corallincola luteus]
MVKGIEDLDLNLMRLLKAVVETRNTHAAAGRLGISQTSVSRGLAKLRETFGDQLFVRKAHGIEPSELAEKLAEAADQMLTPVLKVVENYQNFDPKIYTGEVTIVLSSYLLDVLGKGIYRAIDDALPQATINLVSWQPETLTDLLKGDIDYVLNVSSYPLPQEVYTHPLKEIALRIVGRKNHPVLSAGSDWETFHSLPIARVVIDGLNTKHAPVEVFYRSKGYEANVKLVTHSVSVLTDKLKRSDLITISSSFLTDNEPELATYPLPTVPREMKSITICGGYLQTRRGYPLNQLLHQTMEQYFEALVQPAVE